MRRYRAYGLGIACELPLPLRSAPDVGQADVTFRYAGRTAPHPACGPDRRKLVRRGDDWTLRFDNSQGGWMAFDYSGSERCVQVSGSVGWDHCAGPLAGIVSGVLVRSAGATPLHGACVEIGGRSAAILGASGQGKSTLAAALITRGAELLSEDLLVVGHDMTGFQAEPGGTTLSLLPDAAETFGAAIAFPAHKRAGKVQFQALQSGGLEPVLMAAVFILRPPTPHASIIIKRLSTLEATAQMMEHLYGAPWIRPIADSDLAFCSILARTTPVFSVTRPWALDKIPGIADLLERQVRKELQARNADERDALQT